MGIKVTKKNENKNEGVIKGKILYEDFENDLTEEEKEIAEIKKSGIKKKVSKEEYDPDHDCGTCIYYDEEKYECEKDADYFYHDEHEGGLECDKYEYIYELEK